MDVFWDYEAVSEETLDEARALVDRIREEVRTSRVLLPPAFVAFDTTRSGKLSCSRFRRALNTLQLRSVQKAREPVLQAMCQLFKHEDGELDLIINYREFIKFADASPGSVPPGLSPETVAEMELQGNLRREAAMAGYGRRNDDESKYDNMQATVDGLVELLREECATKRIRLWDFFAPYDPLRKGKIPASKFKSALHMAGITCIHGAKIDLVAQRFQSPNDALFVDYLSCLSFVDPAHMKQDNRLAAKGTREPRRFDTEALEEVLHPMRQICRIRRLHLGGAFDKFDRHNIKSVTRTQFMSVLKTTGLLPKNGVEDAIDVLHDAFPARHPEKINYTEFLHSLEEGI
ncbi:Hypothetical Protein FCC1311_012582 [Hondaea fermentalgiana]|uniref:Uncharacterized protein n=1 Tax=Hondaea fermentalgiana TaxID=2315210 RepID=A0A2R5GAD6_9STRA|nr:Hypothetical Protein FCC1311_012582 [Hondaea fermentalgiana]|eukprot:GBG25041.1 Hypothetical Protein FCC1311_012582 [Hondaea fermentalgiana]